jgi:hypothetical protein
MPKVSEGGRRSEIEERDAALPCLLALPGGGCESTVAAAW